MNLTNKVLGLSLAAFVGFTLPTFADDTPSGGRKSLESRIAELESKLKDAGGGGVRGSGIKVSGFVDTSYLVNLSDRSNSGPIAGSSRRNNGRAFDNQFDAFNLNAFKLTIQKDKDHSKYPAGFRVDTIIGEDATMLKRAKALAGTTFDSDLYLEQAYINLGVPIGNGIDIKVGKMVTLIGYEVIESPANWQFSRSDAFRLAPLTQTGATAGYQWNDMFTTTVGLINGWDSLTGAAASSGAVNYNTDLSFVGRVDVNGPKIADVGDFSSYLAGFYGTDDTGIMGTLGGAAPALNNPNNAVWNIGGMWNKPFNTKQLALGVDYLYFDSQASTAAAAAGVQNLLLTTTASALSGYAKWDWNKWLTSSGRFSFTEYQNIGGQPSIGAGGSTLSPLVLYTGASRQGKERLYSVTLTQAFNVWKDTLVRLEYRRDWTDNTVAGFGTASAGAASRDDIRQEQDTIAVNVVYSF